MHTTAPPSAGTTDLAAELAAELDELRQRLQRTAAIEQAKGVLMCHYGIPEDVAFSVLHRWSSFTNIKVNRLSELVTAAAEASPGPEPGKPRPSLQQVLHDLEARGGRPQ